MVVEILKVSLQKKRTRNPRFSLRAMSRETGIDAGMLSKIFSGKYLPNAATTTKICHALQLTTDETTLVMNSIGQAKFSKQGGTEDDENKPTKSETPKELEDSVFEVISNPCHYAIMELTFVSDFKSDTAWIAKRLGITKLETEYAVARLLRLGLLKKTDGVLVKTNRSLTTKDKSRTTIAHRTHQRALLRAAQQAVEKVPIDQRSTTGMTMAIDLAKIPAAKQLILNFNRQLSELLETGSRQQVYQLSISLFPLEGMFP